MPGIKALQDIPLLYVEEKGKKVMGSTRKSTPERLDKIIQYIWDYQRLHNGETPSAVGIGRNVDINPGGMTYWISTLIDSGRLHKISGSPFRATINMDHKDNKKAIDRFQRLLAAKEEFEAKERDRIRERQMREAAEAQLAEDKQALFAGAADATGTVPSSAPVREQVTDGRMDPEPTQPTVNEPQTVDTQAMAVDMASRLTEAKRQVTVETRAVRSAMPQLIKAAESRDLVIELIERGYVVYKK